MAAETGVDRAEPVPMTHFLAGLTRSLDRHAPRKFDGSVSPEGLGGLQVDHQLEIGWLLDRKVGGFCSFQDFVDVGSGTPMEIRSNYVTGHQATTIP